MLPGCTKASIQRNIVANYLGQGWSALMGLAFLPLYIRYLGVESYALIGLFTVLQSWLSLLDMGMTPTLNREMARYSSGGRTSQSIRDLLRSVEVICLGLALVIALAVWGASGWLAAHWLRAERLPVSAVEHALSVVAAVIALRFVEGLYRGALFGLQQQVWFNAINAAMSTLRWAGAVGVLVWVEPTVEAFFVWQAACSLFTVLVLANRVHRSLPGSPASAKFSRVALESVWQFAGGMMGTTLLVLLLTQVDKVLLSRLLPLESFGYYTLATAIAGSIYLLVGPITAALYPRLVELVTERNETALTSEYHTAAQLLVVLTAPTAFLLALFAPGILYAWSGNSLLSERAGSVLSVLALGTFLNGLMHVPYQLQLAHGWTSLALKCNAVAVLLLVPAVFWLAPNYGALGTAWIWVALNAGYVLVGIQLMHRRLIPGEKWRWYVADVAIPSSAALAVLLGASAWQPAALTARLDWLVFLIASAATATMAALVGANGMRSHLVALIRRRYSVAARPS